MYLPNEITIEFIFYVYAYLRSKDSATGKAGTPYYIGKGCKDRAYKGHIVSVPEDKSLIAFLEINLSEIGALAIERRMIKWHGRKDLGTGILNNRTDGGEGLTNVSDQTRKRMADAKTGKISPKKGIPNGKKGIPTGKREKPSPLKGIKKTETSPLKGRVSPVIGIQRGHNKKKMKQRDNIICPHCNKNGQNSAMQRWHFDKCKLNPDK